MIKRMIPNEKYTASWVGRLAKWLFEPRANQTDHSSDQPRLKKSDMIPSTNSSSTALMTDYHYDCPTTDYVQQCEIMLNASAEEIGSSSNNPALFGLLMKIVYSLLVNFSTSGVEQCFNNFITFISKKKLGSIGR
jgi:hypothetical protein